MTVENTEVSVSTDASSSSESSASSSSSPSTTTEAPVSDSSLPVGSSGTAAPATTPGAAVADGSVVPAAYTPNLKFMVRGKELEIDKLYHGLIKDQETEKKVKELHERAYGLDSVKEDRARTRQELDQVKTNYEAQNNYLNQMGKALRSGNAEVFFDGVGIAGNRALEDVVLQWALNVAQRRQNPQAQSEYMRERQQMEQTSTYEQQVESLRVQNEELATRARTFELDQVIARPEISAVARAFDERAGQPGAFRQQVIERGAYHFAINGQDVSAEQAATEVMRLVGWNQSQQNAPVIPQQGMQAQSAVPSQSAGGAKPVIPNIQGRGTSPARKIARNLDELRQLAREMD